MQIYLKEKIGDPDLFTGRKKELDLFLKWIERIKREISQSTAILSRRKTGKSALLQRLYNLTFEKNDGVIPFYFEIQERSQWIVDFSEDFFLTFIYQYIAFKTRKVEYISESVERSFEQALKIIQAEGLDFLAGKIRGAQTRRQEESADLLWQTACDAPRHIATYNDERVVQFIDEFQFINRFIFRDEACTNRMDDLAGSYLHTAEYKNAPLLIAGSWVGWLMNDLGRLLPGRFQRRFLTNLPQNEAVEMVFKYAHLDDVPVTEETAFLIAELTEGNPFYISSLFRSGFEEKDLTTPEGVLKTLEFEIQDERGQINYTWMEYIQSALPRINDKNAKNIVMYLCQHRDREVGRKELMTKLNLDISEGELEKRLAALVYSDIIKHGRSNFYYRGVQDNIFDKVFRNWYADDIQEFDPQEITNEYKALFVEIKAKYQKLSGEYSYFKGKFAEYVIINHLQYRAHNHSERFKSMLENLPPNFEFAEYQSVWSYSASPVHKRDLQIDLFAQPKPGTRAYSLIGEVKNRISPKFTVEESTHFMEKAQELQKLEQVEKVMLFVFCLAGFHEETLAFFREQGIAWSDDARWIDIGFTG